MKSAATKESISSTDTSPYATRPFSVSTSTIGSNHSAPREPLRIIVAPVTLCAIAAATSSAPTEIAALSPGT